MTTVNLPDLYRRDSEVRRIAREIIKIKRDVRSLSRASQAAYRSSDGDENTPGDYDDDGNPLDPDGNTPDWVPPTPTEPDVNPYREAVEIIWDGTFVDAEWSSSIENVLIHVIPTPYTVPEEATVVGTFGEEGGVFPYNVTIDEPIQYVVLQAVSIHGVVGGWSFPMQLIPLLGVDPADLEAFQDDLDNLNDVVLPDLNSQLDSIQGLFPITSTSIANDAITTPKLIANAVIGDKILANSVYGDRIIANTLYGDRIIVNSLSGDRIIANTIQGDRIIANTLSGDRIIAGTINAGHLSATAIDGKTMTGGVVQTGYPGSTRVVLTPFGSNGHGLEFYVDSSLYGWMVPTTTGGTLQIGTTGGLLIRNSVDINGALNIGGQFGTPGSLNVNNNADISGQLFVRSPTNGSAIPNVRYSSSGAGGELQYTDHANSSRRYKKNIRPLVATLTKDQVLAPEPVSHEMRKSSLDRPTGTVIWGLIAETMHDAGLSPFLGYDEKNRPDEVDWAKFAAVGHQLVLREHDRTITDHGGKIGGMIDEIAALRAEIAELKNPA